ncbi:MAG: flagellar basal body P-ring formation protein FlgA [Phycisphaerales bacterium]|nr:flagellar basal body P-ring formation protein FlgA [Phycisphaerales bacterium]
MIYTRLPIRLALLLFTLALLVPAAIADDITTVKLFSTVRMQEGSVCTLGSIAEISGLQADALSGLEIEVTPKVGEWTTVEVENIRKLIKETPSIRGGSVIVIGHTTQLTWRNTLSLVPESSGSEPELLLPIVEPDPTVGDRVRAWLAKRYGVTPEDMKTTFRESDEAEMNKSAVGKMVEVSEIGSSVNTKLRITVYRGERFESSYTVSAAVRVLRPVLVVQQDIDRGVIVESSMIRIEKRWYPAQDAPAQPGEVLGLASTTSLRAGDVIRVEDVTMPIVIKRGDIVSVRSIAGSIVANRRARALEDARDGEVFKLESIDRKDRFTARASGPGQAIIADTANQTTTQVPAQTPIGE